MPNKSNKTLCVVKVTFVDSSSPTGQSILVQDMYLDLDESVEDQVYDFFGNSEIYDFKWSEDLTAFNSATLPVSTKV